MAIDLQSLSAEELNRLEGILRALPGDKLLDAVSWESIAEAVRAPATATVAGALAAIERKREGERVKFELGRKIQLMGQRPRASGRQSKPCPPTCRHVCCNPPPQISESERRAHIREMEQRLAEMKAQGQSDTHDCHQLSLAWKIARIGYGSYDDDDDDYDDRRRRRRARLNDDDEDRQARSSR